MSISTQLTTKDKDENLTTEERKKSLIHDYPMPPTNNNPRPEKAKSTNDKSKNLTKNTIPSKQGIPTQISNRDPRKKNNGEATWLP